MFKKKRKKEKKKKNNPVQTGWGGCPPLEKKYIDPPPQERGGGGQGCSQKASVRQSPTTPSDKGRAPQNTHKNIYTPSRRSGSHLGFVLRPPSHYLLCRNLYPEFDCCCVMAFSTWHCCMVPHTPDMVHALALGANVGCLRIHVQIACWTPQGTVQLSQDPLGI